jgi:hypothetical protein
VYLVGWGSSRLCIERRFARSRFFRTDVLRSQHTALRLLATADHAPTVEAFVS